MTKKNIVTTTGPDRYCWVPEKMMLMVVARMIGMGLMLDQRSSVPDHGGDSLVSFVLALVY